MICIWCKKDFPRLSLEHGIPEALACPPELELRNVACTKCNNDLSRVDKALIKSFEMITVMYGVPRKKGRPPVIASWRPIRSEHRADGPHIYINGGPGVVSAMGKPLHPATKSTGVSNVWASPETGKLGFSWEMGNDPRFIPALFKIGLNVVAKVHGPEMAASNAYDHIRALVLLEPQAPIMTAALETNVVHAPLTAATLLSKPNRPYPMCRITILGVTLLIDLDPDQKSLTDICGAATLMGEPMYTFPTAFRMATSLGHL